MAAGLGAGFGAGFAFFGTGFGFGLEAATAFLAIGFAAFAGVDLPDLGFDLATGLEGLETFLAALDLAAGRDGLFEEVVFVFNLLSVRPGEKADEHLPCGLSGQGFVFGIFASRLPGWPGLRCDS